MRQAFQLPTVSAFSSIENADQRNQHWLDQLAENKLSWEPFLLRVGKPLAVSRLIANHNSRTILHLAVLDNRQDIVQTLTQDASLKLRRDSYGLSAIELAQLLDRKECLRLLQPLYHTRLETWNFDRAKTARIDDRKPVNIRNMDQFTTVDSSEFSRGSKSTFQAACGISEVTAFHDWPHMSECEYLSCPIFETKDGFEEVLTQTAKAKREDKIPAEKIWMGIYFDKEIRQGSHPPISIRYIDEVIGCGVFAEKKIAPCTFVGEYVGLIQERKPKQLTNKRYCLRYAIWGGRKNFCIDAEHKGNFTRFINHSAHPNLGLQSIYWRGISRMIFVALKEIQEKDQLTFDYGPLFWKGFRRPLYDF